MSINQLVPYLNFAGDAEQAIRFYERALGAKAGEIMRWGDLEGMNVPPTHKGRVMHCELRIGAGTLMLADCPGDEAVDHGSTSICLQFDSSAELQERFDALAEGGNVVKPVHDAFWGDRFGMLQDRFGVRWMFVGTKSQK